MKIWCQLPVRIQDKQFAPFREVVQKNYDAVKRKDTEVVIKGVARGLLYPEAMGYLGLQCLNDAEVLKSILRAESEGFDGVSIGCFFDPALRAAKQLLKIPVTGVGESAMHLACMMGLKFAIITSDSRYIPGLEEKLNGYGLCSNAIARKPVRSLTISGEELSGCLCGHYAPVTENFKQIAAGCIEDGAEVLIAGCGCISPMLSQNGVIELDGVPIIDPLQASLKLTEMLVDLHKAGIPTVSKNLLYVSAPTRKLIEEELAHFG